MTAAKCDDWIADGARIEGATSRGACSSFWSSQAGLRRTRDSISRPSAHDGRRISIPPPTSARTGVPADDDQCDGRGLRQSRRRACDCAGTDDSSAHLAAMILNAVTGNFGKYDACSSMARRRADTRRRTKWTRRSTAMRGGEIDVAVINRGRESGVHDAAVVRESPRLYKRCRSWCGRAACPTRPPRWRACCCPRIIRSNQWRDTAPRAGVRGLGQPVMQPVFDSKPLGDILLAAALAKPSSTKLPVGRLPPRRSKPNGSRWLRKADDATLRRFLDKRRGAKADLFEATAVAALKPRHVDRSKRPLPDRRRRRNFTFVAYPHIFLYDGRGADKPWLQELPEPVTQIVWDSWAEIHPETARKLGVARDDIIELKTEHGAIEAPVAGRDHRASRRDRRAARPGTYARTAAMRKTSARMRGRSCRRARPTRSR